MISSDLLLKVLAQVLDDVREGIIVTDKQGKIIYYNKELAKLEGLEPANVIGKHLTEVYEIAEASSEHLQVIKKGVPILEMRKTYFTNDGREMNIVASTYPVYQEGKVIAAYSVCKDITKMKELLAQNRQLQEQITHESRKVSGNNGTRYTFDSIVYSSDVMRNLLVSAKKAAEADCAILIYGETGTGKELLAQGIHNHSRRKSDSFVAVNCAAIPDTLLESVLFGTVKGAFTGAVDSQGLFEQAGGGTLFLDEINSMSPALQAKLLRVLQEKRVRRVGSSAEVPVLCRVVSSTNADPWRCIEKGELREDLYYRLAVISLNIPPLRERREDLPVLVEYFLAKYQKFYGLARIELAPEMKSLLAQYQWPGNIRELDHVIESALNMMDGEEMLTTEHLPLYLKSKLASKQSGVRVARTGGLAMVLAKAEEQAILETLEGQGWNISKSARELGIARQNLQYRMRKLGIKA